MGLLLCTNYVSRNIINLEDGNWYAFNLHWLPCIVKANSFVLGLNNSSSITCTVEVDSDAIEADAVEADADAVEADAIEADTVKADTDEVNAIDPVAGGKFWVGTAVRTKNMFDDISFTVKCWWWHTR